MRPESLRDLYEEEEELIQTILGLMEESGEADAELLFQEMVDSEQCDEFNDLLVRLRILERYGLIEIDEELDLQEDLSWEEAGEGEVIETIYRFLIKANQDAMDALLENEQADEEQVVAAIKDEAKAGLFTWVMLIGMAVVFIASIFS